MLLLFFFSVVLYVYRAEHLLFFYLLLLFFFLSRFLPWYGGWESLSAWHKSAYSDYCLLLVDLELLLLDLSHLLVVVLFTLYSPLPVLLPGLQLLEVVIIHALVNELVFDQFEHIYLHCSNRRAVWQMPNMPVLLLLAGHLVK